MKVVKLSHPNYEYDVHSLVKAFYAEDQVTVITPETKPEKLAELEPQVSLEIELAETGAKIRVGEEDFSVGCRDRKPLQMGIRTV